MIKFTWASKLFLVGAIFIFGLFLSLDSALAAATYNALVTIPYMPLNPNASDYLSGIYTFLTRVVGIVAMGAIVIGGARYLTSVGNPSAVEDAKHTINSAIIGLILALSSWVIVTEINPDITVLKNPTMVAAPIGTYDSSSSTAAKCAFMSEGTGIVGSPCKCIDGNDAYAVGMGGKSTSITLAIDLPSTDNLTDHNVIMSGTLIDATTGVGIVGATVKINRLYSFGGASNTNVMVTGPGGNFSFSYHICNAASCGGPGNQTCTTAAAGDAVQAVFYGGVIGPTTYSGSGSSIVQFIIGGNPKPCVPTDYFAPSFGPVATLWSGAASSTTNQCNEICYDKTKSDDGEHHCISVQPRIATVAPDAIAAYTMEQIRALAVNRTELGSPYIIPNQSAIVVDVVKNSTAYYLPVTYKIDDGFTGTCTSVLPSGMWNVTLSYALLTGPLPPTCKLVPKGVTCSQKYCITDSQGNSGESILYFTLLSSS